MKTVMRREKGRIRLAYPDVATKEECVLASMTHYEGTGCWVVGDIRLARYARPSPFSCAMESDSLHAEYKPTSEEERTFVKGFLKEHVESVDGTLMWCPYDGIVRGAPEIDGYTPTAWRKDRPSLYFGYLTALAKLAEIRAFWDGFEGDPRNIKIDNPHRQPSFAEMINLVVDARLEGVLADTRKSKKDDDEANPARHKP